MTSHFSLALVTATALIASTAYGGGDDTDATASLDRVSSPTTPPPAPLLVADDEPSPGTAVLGAPEEDSDTDSVQTVIIHDSSDDEDSDASDAPAPWSLLSPLKWTWHAIEGMNKVLYGHFLTWDDGLPQEDTGENDSEMESQESQDS